MTCELSNECVFARCEDFHAVYCCENPTLCARRWVAISAGTEAVPQDLLPGQSERVLDVIFNVADDKVT